MKQIIEFAVKAAKKFSSKDFSQLDSLENIKKLLRGYGYPKDKLNNFLNENNYEQIADAIIDSAL